MTSQDDQRSTMPPPIPDRNQTSKDALEVYEVAAETVGMIPSLRVNDHVVQSITALLGLVVGAVAGATIAVKTGFEGGPVWGAIMGGVCGALVGVFLCGFILMILGWVRLVKRAR